MRKCATESQRRRLAIKLPIKQSDFDLTGNAIKRLDKCAYVKETNSNSAVMQITIKVQSDPRKCMGSNR